MLCIAKPEDPDTGTAQRPQPGFQGSSFPKVGLVGCLFDVLDVKRKPLSPQVLYFADYQDINYRATRVPRSCPSAHRILCVLCSLLSLR